MLICQRVYCLIISSSWHDWHDWHVVMWALAFAPRESCYRHECAARRVSHWLQSAQQIAGDHTQFCSQSGYENLRLLGSAVAWWFTPSRSIIWASTSSTSFFWAWNINKSMKPSRTPGHLQIRSEIAFKVYFWCNTFVSLFFVAAFVQVMPSFSRTWLHRRSHTSSRPEMSCQLGDDVTVRENQ